MGEIAFVGLGLDNETGMSLHGLKEVKSADSIFIELYTSLMPGFSLKNLEKMAGKRIQILMRKELEEDNGEAVLRAAERGKTVMLVPGDPLIATTHVALRMVAEKRAIRTRLIHGASIVSAVIGLSGLHNYKFGKGVTVPFPAENPSGTPYEVIFQNKKAGLHTLCLLDIDVEKNHFLTIHEALYVLLDHERQKKRGVVTPTTLAVGIARAGSERPVVKANCVNELLNYDFGKPPYSLIFTAGLHFMEAEALIAFAGAPRELEEVVR